MNGVESVMMIQMILAKMKDMMFIDDDVDKNLRTNINLTCPSNFPFLFYFFNSKNTDVEYYSLK